MEPTKTSPASISGRMPIPEYIPGAAENSVSPTNSLEETAPQGLQSELETGGESFSSLPPEPPKERRFLSVYRSHRKTLVFAILAAVLLLGGGVTAMVHSRKKVEVATGQSSQANLVDPTTQILTINSKLLVEQNTDILGDLTVKGATTLGQGLTVTGNGNFSGNITAANFSTSSIQVNGSGNFAGTLQVSNVRGTNITITGNGNFAGDINIAGTVQGNMLDGNSFAVNGVAGASVVCSGGDVLANADIQSGIVVGGNCTTVSGGGGGGTTDLQTAYNNSTSPEFVLNSTNGALTLRDTLAGLGGNLFEVQNNGGTVTYFAVSSAGVSVTGGLMATTLAGSGAGVSNVDALTLQSHSSAFFTNASNLSSGTVSDARLSANVTLQGNTFNGVNQLVQLNGSGALPALSGANLTSLNASNVSSGTLADARLSGNVAFLSAAANFLNSLQHNGNDVCDTSGNCAGAGGGVTGSGTSGNIAKFNGSGSITNSSLSESGTTLTASGNMIIQGSNSLILGTIAASGTVHQGQLTLADGTTSNFGLTLQSATLTANRTITLPNETGTICLQTSANCGFATSSGGTGYIQNGTAVQTSANFNIQAIDSGVNGTIGAIVRGAAGGQTVDLQEWQASNGAVKAYVTNTGQVWAQSFGALDSNSGSGFYRTSILNATSSVSTLTVQQLAASATSPVMTIQEGATPGAAADLLRFLDGASATLAKIDNAGNLAFGGNGSTHSVSVTARSTNAAGDALNVQAGNGGAGASGVVGGNVTISGGNAAGTTGSATGGNVTIQGGSGVNGGTNGSVTLASTGGTVSLIGNTIACGTQGTNCVISTTSFAGFAGGIYLDTASGTNNIINIGTVVSSGVTIGRSGAAFTLQGSSSSVIKGTSGAFTTTLGFTTPTANRAINLPDEAGTLCIQSSANCSFAPATGGSGYIQNGTTIQTSASFFIQGGVGSVGGIIKANGADTLEFQNSSGSTVANVDAFGDINAQTFVQTGTTSSSTLYNADIRAGLSGANALLVRGTIGQSVAVLSVKGGGAATGNVFEVQGAGTAQMYSIDNLANQETIGYYNNADGGIGPFANLLTYSEQFDNAAWTKTNVTTPTADTDVSPDSNTTAESLADSVSGGSISQTSGTAPTNNSYTFSIWLKTGSGTQTVDLRIDGATSGTGTKKTVTAATTWQRFSVTQNTNGFTGNIKVLIFPGGTGGSGTVSAWGAQLVLGSTPLVYARATGSSVTASGGVVSNGGLFVSSLNSNDKPLIVQAAPGQTGDLLQLQNSTSAVIGGISASGQFYSINGGFTGSLSFGSLSQNTVYTIPASIGASDTICLQTLANCSGAGASSVGALDGGTANVNGATIASNVLYLQSASASFAGLISTAAQTFAGAKTFNGDTTIKTTSGTAFQIQNASASTLLTADTSNMRVSVGTAATFTGYASSPSLAARADYTSGTGPSSLISPDVNGDGKADLVTINQSSSNLSVLKNNTDGTFGTNSNYATDSGPAAGTYGDFNGDGKVDLLVAPTTTSQRYVTFMAGNGLGAYSTQSGSFVSGSSTIYTNYSIAAADFNGDGKLDYAFPNYANTFVSQTAGTQTYIGMGVGNGTFGTASAFNDGLSGGFSIVAADFNGDGKPDIAVGGGSLVGVSLNSGTGTFPTATNYVVGSSGGYNTGTPNWMAATDFNNDGKPDIVVTNSLSNTVSVLLNNGNGTFAARSDYTTGTTPRGVGTLDVNNDGWADIVTANYGSNTISVFLNNGNGTFAAKTDYATPTNPIAISIADYNGDGKNDIAVANNGSNNVSVFMNSSTTFSVGAGLSVVAPNSSSAALTLQGAVGQSVDYVRVQNSSNAPLFTITANGLVGIGTATPQAALDVVGDINATGTFRSAATTGIGVDLSNLTTGIGLNVGAGTSTTATGILFNANSPTMTTATALSIAGTLSSNLSGYTGNLININVSRTNTTTSGVVTDSGHYLNIVRSNAQNGTGGTFAVSGSLVNLQSSCVNTAGACNDTANILNLNQQNGNASGAVLNIQNSSIGAGANFAQTSGTAISLATTTGTGISIGSLSNGTAISISATANGNGINFGGSGSWNNIISGTVSTLTGGNGLLLSGSSSGTLSSFTGNYINVSPSRTSTAVSGTLTDSGHFLNLNRSNTQFTAGGTYVITGSLANLQSNCTQTAGTCTDSAQILTLNQQYANATGTVAFLQNSGTGAAVQIADGSGNVNANFNNVGNQLTLGRIAASGTVTQGKLILADGATDNFGLTLQSSTLTASRTITLPDEAGTVCLESSSSCGFVTGSGAAFVQNGNSFGAQAVLGTNDGNNLAFRTNNGNRLILDTTGNLTFQQASTIGVSGTGALTINTASSASTNTAAITIQSGSASAGANLNAGAVTIDTGTFTGVGNANLNLGSANARAVQLGNTTNTGTLSLDVAASGILNIGTGNVAGKVVNIGNTGATAQSGTIHIGDTTGASGQTVTIGSLSAASFLALQGGTSGATLKTGSSTTSGGITIQSGNASAGASGNVTIDTGTFTSGTPTLNIGNTNAKAITLGNSATALTLQGTSASVFKGSSGGFTATLGFITPTASRTINLPDEAGTICLQGSANCGFITGSGAAVTTLGAIDGTGSSNANGATISGNTLYLNSASASFGGVVTTAAQTFGGTKTFSNGIVTSTIKPTADSTTAFQIQNAAGTSTLFNADTTNQWIGIDTTAPSAPLTVGLVSSASNYSFGFETGTIGELTASTTGTINTWTADTSLPNTGTYSAKTTPNGSGIGTSTLQLVKTLTAGGTITFYEKTSNGASGTDPLTFYIDGVQKGQWVSNCCGYAQQSYAVTSGTHTFTWVYSTPGNQNTFDSVYVDDITLSNVAASAVSASFAGNVGIGTSTPTATLQVLSGTTSAFQVQNASGNSVLTVDGLNSQVLLGKAGGSGLDGKLVFQNATNANTITLQAGVASTSYTINLPTAGPSAGQCLRADSTTASQLTFGACDTIAAVSVSGQAITYVSSANTVNATIPSGTRVGDLLVMTVGHGFSVTNPAGWTVLDNTTGSNVNGGLYYKTATSGDIGGTVTINFSGTFSGEVMIAAVRHAGGVRAYIADRNSSGTTSDAIGPVSGIKNDLMLYMGEARLSNTTFTLSRGSILTQRSADSSAGGVIGSESLAADTSVTQTFGLNSTPTGRYYAVIAISPAASEAATLQNGYDLSAGSTTPEVKLDTTRGALDIQDADTSIAGTLLAVRASNSSALGATLFSVNSTGQTTFKNSSDSTTALQIQNAAGTSTVMNIDTTHGFVGVNTTNTLAPLTVGVTSGGTYDFGFETGSLAPFYWGGSGYAWAADTTFPHTGSYDAHVLINSGGGGVGDLHVNKTLASNGTVSFWYKNTQGASGDVLTFYIDGVSQGTVNPTTTYQQTSFAVSSGTHDLQWYAHGINFDDIYIDDVSITNVASSNTSAVFNGFLGVNNTAPANYLNINAAATADSLAQALIATGGTGNKGMVIQGTSGQTGSLLELQNNSGNPLAKFNANGDLIIGGTASAASSNAFQVQDTSGVAFLTVDSSTLTLTVTNVVITASLTVNGHIISGNSSGTTTINAQAAATCTSGSPSVSVTGDDTAGIVSVTTATGICSAGALVDVFYANAYTAAPAVVLTPGNAASASLQYYYNSVTGNFAIKTGTAPSSSTTYIFSYHVIQ